jgi:prolyl-tRNA editing enzyme YbaK/EbsC (Cys-tRNA(Pro) deacylase)
VVHTDLIFKEDTMSKSMKRVQAAIGAAGLSTEIHVLPDSARTAADAASAVKCDVGQIAKSMIFEGQQSGKLKLLLVSGAHDADLERAKVVVGEPLVRADAKRVRTETGFAIGGVSPIGHLNPIETWMDRTLLAYDVVWGAGGAPHAVFPISPDDLQRVTGAQIADIHESA